MKISTVVGVSVIVCVPVGETLPVLEGVVDWKKGSKDKLIVRAQRRTRSIRTIVEEVDAVTVGVPVLDGVTLLVVVGDGVELGVGVMDGVTTSSAVAGPTQKLSNLGPSCSR
jgi:hypothetical protein